MKKNYDISIVVPCYNCEKYVEETIHSILKQDYDLSKIEIILINDGSTDNTINILNSYKKENIVVIDKQNEGVSKTRNLGIKKARGKYILFLDGDDFLSKNSIKKIIAFFDKHYDEVDLVTYPLIMYYNKHNQKIHFRYNKEYRNGTGVYPLDRYYKITQTGINIVIKNNKKHFFDFHKKYGEDEYFDTAILMEKKKIGYVAEAKYYYRQHSESITHKKKIQDFEEHYKFYDEELIKYDRHIYIQYLVVNNLRWRIEEDCLYPSNTKNINEYVSSITRRLEQIDLSLFQNDVNEQVLLNLIGLQSEKYELKDKEVWIKKKKVGVFQNYNKINRIEIHNNKIKIFGRLETPYLKNKPNFFINGSKVSLFFLANYQKNIIGYYVKEIDICNSIEFKLLGTNQEYELITEPVDWACPSKVIGNYNVKIDGRIKIRKKTMLSRIKNKYKNIHSFKFLCLNILATFYFRGKGKTLYFTNRDSEVYNLYQKDLEGKVWLEKTNGIRYKLLILNCNKLVTDRGIREVLPFGRLRKNYVQSSKFEVKVYGDEFEKRL